MPNQEVSHLYQRVVLWPTDGVDKYGQYTVGDPEEIAGRWMDSRKTMMDPAGNVISVDGTLIVAQEIAIGSRVWQGSLDDLPGTGTAYLPDEDWCEVKAVDDTADIKGRARFRELGLVKLRNEG